MIGAIVGDIVGSRYERHNHKSKDFKLFDNDCRMTDDSIMTLAVMDAILRSDKCYSLLGYNAIQSMVYFGKKYPDAGYGKLFKKWLSDPVPYNSYGNGAAMRVSPCGIIANNSKEAIDLSYKVTRISHNHQEGIKGAEAVSLCIYMAQPHNMCLKYDIERAMSIYYDLDFTIDSIRDSYEFDVSCQGTVPVAIKAFLESTDFEDAIRTAVSVGGDSDTIAAITGSIAGMYYGIPDDIFNKTISYLDDEERDIVLKFQNLYLRKHASK